MFVCCFPFSDSNVLAVTSEDITPGLWQLVANVLFYSRTDVTCPASCASYCIQTHHISGCCGAVETWGAGYMPGVSPWCWRVRQGPRSALLTPVPGLRVHWCCGFEWWGFLAPMPLHLEDGVNDVVSLGSGWHRRDFIRRHSVLRV